MKNYTYIFLFLSLVLLFAAEIKAQPVSGDYKIVNFESDALQMRRPVWIKLPKDYKQEKDYPLMLVLDAEKHFDLVLQMMQNRIKYGKLEEHIIVGIPNLGREDRSRNLTFSTSGVGRAGQPTRHYTQDNTGHAVTFVKFIEEEIFPVLEKKYSFKKDNISIFGHSFSAYFALILSTKTSIFNNIISIDPSLWYSDNEAGSAINEAKNKLQQQSNINYFIAYQDAVANNAEKARELVKLLQQNNINVQAWEFQHENHGSVILPAFIAILRKLGEDLHNIPAHKK